MRLLDDLGWDRDDARNEYVLSMAAPLLTETIRHLNESASADVRHHLVEQIERREVVERSVTASARTAMCWRSS